MGTRGRQTRGAKAEAKTPVHGVVPSIRKQKTAKVSATGKTVKNEDGVQLAPVATKLVRTPKAAVEDESGDDHDWEHAMTDEQEEEEDEKDEVEDEDDEEEDEEEKDEDTKPSKEKAAPSTRRDVRSKAAADVSTKKSVKTAGLKSPKVSGREDVNCRVFVGSLTTNTKVLTLRAYCDRFGYDLEKIIMIEKKNYAFVIFTSASDAKNFVRGIGADGKNLLDENGLHVLNGKSINVSIATPKDDSRAPPALPDLQMSPEDAQVMASVEQMLKIFVGGIPDINDEEFTAYFGKYGTLVSCAVVRDSATKRCKGYGFVKYDSLSAIKKVLSEKHVMQGRLVDVKFAQRPSLPPAEGSGAPPPAFNRTGGGGYGAGDSPRARGDWKEGDYFAQNHKNQSYAHRPDSRKPNSPKVINGPIMPDTNVMNMMVSGGGARGGVPVGGWAQNSAPPILPDMAPPVPMMPQPPSIPGEQQQQQQQQQQQYQQQLEEHKRQMQQFQQFLTTQLQNAFAPATGAPNHQPHPPPPPPAQAPPSVGVAMKRNNNNNVQQQGRRYKPY